MYLLVFSTLTESSIRPTQGTSATDKVNCHISQTLKTLSELDGGGFIGSAIVIGLKIEIH